MTTRPHDHLSTPTHHDHHHQLADSVDLEYFIGILVWELVGTIVVNWVYKLQGKLLHAVFGSSISSVVVGYPFLATVFG